MIWTRDNINISDERFTAENGRLIIDNVHMEDDGNYQCSIFRNGIQGTKTIRVEVVPRSEFAPMIDDSTRSIEVMYGDPLNLPCPLNEPRDDVVYSWTINTEFEHNHIMNTRATLHRGADQFLGGSYTCRAENEYGYDVANFIVKITGKYE